MTKESAPRKPNPVRRFFSLLGPGLITGAADDDPSGVATYSIAGAQLGTSLLWTAFITWPLMGAVQFMCARIGMVTGQGLGAAFGRKFPRPLIILASVALLGANTINVGADLSGMADAAEMLTGFNSHWFVVLFGLGIAFATIRFRYYQIAMILKWLALFLFAYVITAFIVGPDWKTVLHDTCSLLAEGARRVAESGCDSRNHNQPVLVLLAVFARSGARKGDGSPHGAAA